MPVSSCFGLVWQKHKSGFGSYLSTKTCAKLYRKNYKVNSDEKMKINQAYMAVILILIGCSFSFRQHDNTKLIVGEWEGKMEGVHALLSFSNSNTGFIKYSMLEDVSIFKFRYLFKTDSVIEISNGNSKSMHLIRFLDKKELRLRPYPLKQNNKTVDVINIMNFVRK